MRRTRVACVLLMLASACTGGKTEASPTVAFFYDGTVETSSYLVTPSFQGLRLALLQSEVKGGPDVEVEQFDTRGDPAKALQMATAAAAEPTLIAVVAAPFWLEPPQVAGVFAKAGVPTLSLSAFSQPGPAGSWFRLVPDESSEIDALSTALFDASKPGATVCIADDGSAYGRQLLEEVLATMTDQFRLTHVEPSVESVRTARCGALVWTGFPADGETLRTELDDAGMGSIPMVASDALKTETYLASTAAAGEGTVLVCPCADLSTTTTLAGQRFVHDYQAEFTSPPWPYAAEGFDAAGLILRGLRSGLARADVLHSLAAGEPYEGVAGSYGFDSGGELSGRAAGIYRDEGQRWVRIGEATLRDYPTVHPGTITFGACQDFAPFAYRSHGRSLGFEVELGHALARQLGIGFRWKGCRTPQSIGKTVDVLLAPSAPSDPQPIALAIRAVVVLRRHVGYDDGCRRHGAKCYHAMIEGPFVTQPLLSGEHDVRFSYRDPERAYGDLEHGRINSLIDVEYRAWAEIEHHTDLRVAQSTGESTFAFSANDPLVQRSVNEALAELLRDGTYARLFAKYFPGVPQPSNIGT